nr:Chain A, Esculentin-1A [Pelophylax lessonae]5XDJ_A Chain A, Esculentin-1A [Pelophylax lessonae]
GIFSKLAGKKIKNLLISGLKG